MFYGFTLAEGVVDMRGLWHGVSGRIGHLERIEQCGNRVVVTAYRTIHDFRVDSTLKNRARDVGVVCNNFNTAILGYKVLIESEFFALSCKIK